MEKTVSRADVTELAKKLAPKLYPGLVIALNGDLGAGKTTFTQELTKAAGVTETVNSPTFVLMNVYNGPLRFYHFDLYRLSTIDDLENIGGEELIPSTDGVTIIEWAEKIPEILPEKYLQIDIAYKNAHSRIFNIQEHGTCLFSE
jgi:tRNA threonylcarbamoyladenosine biosynthesis protein TsaE